MPATKLTAGVPACWDYLNSGTSSGVIAGSVNGGTSPFSNGQKVECATWTATPTGSRKTLVASPQWVRQCIDEIAADASAPWFILWTYTIPSMNSDYTNFHPLQVRSDFVAAYDYAVNKGLARATADALRTPKVWA